MMQAEFAHGRRNSFSKFAHTIFIGRMRKHDQFRAVDATHNVAGAAQTATDSLTNPAQAGVGRVATEHVDIGIEFVKRKDDDR